MLLQCNDLCKPTLSEYLPSDSPRTAGGECSRKTQHHRRRVYTSTRCGPSNCHCECWRCGYISLWLKLKLKRST